MASFEEALQQLEAIVERLERGDVPLEEAVKLFEDGSKLANTCKEQLETAEGKVQILLKQRDGKRKAVAFEPGES